jgi:uncharacterized protein YkwD
VACLGEELMIRSLTRCVALVLLLIPGVRLAGADGRKETARVQLSEAEKTILELTNKERARKKLPPLEPEPILFKVARAHSANMARKGEMKHVLDDKTPAQRVDEAGYDYGRVGENIAFSDGLRPAEIVRGWMDSKVHRDNILNPKFKHIGLGVARNDQDEFYYAQVFGTPREE